MFSLNSKSDTRQGDNLTWLGLQCVRLIALKNISFLNPEGDVKGPLTCWKAIAAYIGKDVRTAQRWEHDLGLPVRRPHTRIVVALPHEIDEWLAKGPLPNSSTPYLPMNIAVDQSEPLLTSLKIAYSAFDWDLNYRHANAKGCFFMQRNLQDIVGNSVFDVHPGLDRTMLGRHFAIVSKAKTPGMNQIDHYHSEVDRYFRNIILTNAEGIESFWRDVTSEIAKRPAPQKGAPQLFLG